MSVTIDITQDLRYQQGRNESKAEDKAEIAENLLKEGVAILFVQKVTGLPLNKIEEIALKLGQH